jgi:hypothetical protein
MNIYILSILILPITMKKTSVLIFAFLAGFLIDIMSNTMGIHAAATTCIGFFRPLFLPNNSGTVEVATNRRKERFGWVFNYMFSLTLIFNVVLVMTETFSFDNFGITILRILFSTVVSCVLMLLYYFIAIKEKQK